MTNFIESARRQPAEKLTFSSTGIIAILIILDFTTQLGT